jgi:aerobic-type carbon monoxide dehydrogenase small subunit (CoxS/CutS family)
MIEAIRFVLNGKPVSLEADGDRPLLWVLRADLGLTGAKYGCGEALCGACTVLVDGAAVRFCQAPVRSAHGRKVTTIEGLAHDGKLHPVQAAFVKHDALQCGFCTPGMILKAVAFLAENPDPTPERVKAALAGAAPLEGGKG